MQHANPNNICLQGISAFAFCSIVKEVSTHTQGFIINNKIIWE